MSTWVCPKQGCPKSINIPEWKRSILVAPPGSSAKKTNPNLRWLNPDSCICWAVSNWRSRKWQHTNRLGTSLPHSAYRTRRASGWPHRKNQSSDRPERYVWNRSAPAAAASRTSWGEVRNRSMSKENRPFFCTVGGSTKMPLSFSATFSNSSFPYNGSPADPTRERSWADVAALAASALSSRPRRAIVYVGAWISILMVKSPYLDRHLCWLNQAKSPFLMLKSSFGDRSKPIASYHIWVNKQSLASYDFGHLWYQSFDS